MKAKEVYLLPVKETSKDIGRLSGYNYTHIPEIEFDDIWEIEDKNEKIEIKSHVSYSFDGRRGWWLSSVWFDSLPIMIIQNAGREGDDHSERFITNEIGFKNMLEYIRSILPKKEDEVIEDLIDEEIDIECLTEFYSHKLEEFYNKGFIPQYKVGDIITVSVTKNDGYYMDKELIQAKVEILDVSDMPCDTYRVKEVERKIHRKRWNKENDKTEIKYINEIQEEEKECFDFRYLRLDANLQLVV